MTLPILLEYDPLTGRGVALQDVPEELDHRLRTALVEYYRIMFAATDRSKTLTEQEKWQIKQLMIKQFSSILKEQEWKCADEGICQIMDAEYAQGLDYCQILCAMWSMDKLTAEMITRVLEAEGLLRVESAGR